MLELALDNEALVLHHDGEGDAMRRLLTFKDAMELVWAKIFWERWKNVPKAEWPWRARTIA